MNTRDELILNYAKDPFLSQSLLSFLCGKHIGSGCYRDVFEYGLDSNYVIKIQRDLGKFSNIIEWEIWCTLMYTEYAKHFARCKFLSPDGRILIQRKTQPITDKRKAPENIPHFFSDIKDSNFGFIGKQFVAHDYDYSMVKFINSGLTKRTKKYKSHLK